MDDPVRIARYEEIEKRKDLLNGLQLELLRIFPAIPRREIKERRTVIANGSDWIQMFLFTRRAVFFPVCGKMPSAIFVAQRSEVWYTEYDNEWTKANYR